jgi:hypothetical protein
MVSPGFIRVANVAGYEPPVQRSDYGRRDPRFDFGRRDPRFCWTPPRVSLELVYLAHPTVTGHAAGHALYSSAHARIQMQTPWTGDCISRITAHGHRNCEHSSHKLSRLRLANCATEWISPHSTSSVRGCSTPPFACAPPGCLGMCLCLAHPELASDPSLVLSCAVLPVFDIAWRTHVTPIHSNIFS